MNRLETFQQFITSQNTHLFIPQVILSLFLAGFLSFLLSRVYIKYGFSLSNRRMFARNFVLLTMTTMFIITVVKSSLALSLGLVGALSIVRFRAAIKEPEELSYLFFAIAIGLGLGANQTVITIITFVTVCGVIIIGKRYRKFENNKNLYLTITTYKDEKISLGKIMEILEKQCSLVDMRRFDETKEALEVLFLIELDNLGNLDAIKTELQKLNDSVKIAFLDNRGTL